ncbi:DNA repair protein RecO [filamentous cyanobacterium LEGE 11480]|uniref:DNA repair protein RecO n=1 Tax=Romeriopsis navalis LEGE 11480 TaxID=2777977 RepID=A0A928VI65_9CYAN|nr:DNA repair protein RecO [Romeriopsis navalis]MBE9028137.1 DNA repair protein RecO [Romeriopsis navalis LEGE 11480]
MGKTFRVTGINLKAMPLGEADRILTILSPEEGLLRATAPGARKQNSKLGGRSGLFVINDLLLAKGKSLDRISQAETIESYPGLSRDLAKLTAGQYIAELALHQALTEHPQAELYYLLTEHLRRIANADNDSVLAMLAQAVYQLLALAGVAPQVQQCSISNQLLEPDLSIGADWQVGFSIEGGGIVSLAALSAQLTTLEASRKDLQSGKIEAEDFDLVRESVGEYQVRTIEQLPKYHRRQRYSGKSEPQTMLLVDAIELYLMQQLAQEALPQVSDNTGFAVETIQGAWRKIERILRQYAQYHFDRQIRSAKLIDSCFAR